jgi:hypothetical protein
MDTTVVRVRSFSARERSALLGPMATVVALSVLGTGIVITAIDVGIAILLAISYSYLRQLSLRRAAKRHPQPEGSHFRVVASLNGEKGVLSILDDHLEWSPANGSTLVVPDYSIVRAELRRLFWLAITQMTIVSWNGDQVEWTVSAHWREVQAALAGEGGGSK